MFTWSKAFFRTHRFSFLSLFIVLTWSSVVLASNFQTEECNGSPLLCKKPYNQVTFPTSHNALSYIPTLDLAPKLSFLPKTWIDKLSQIFAVNVNDQDVNLAQQLKDGIRAMKLRVMNADQGPHVCHGIGDFARSQIKEKACKHLPFTALEKKCNEEVDKIDPCIVDPAAISFTAALRKIKDFLNQNPHEVLTLFLEDNVNHFEVLKKSFLESGIAKYTHHQSTDKAWPTLKQMIQDDKRLVVFVNGDADEEGHKIDRYPIFNKFENFVWGSRYHFEATEELIQDQPTSNEVREIKSFIHNKKTPANKLWVLQHFITPDIAGRATFANQVNQSDVLLSRISRYKKVLRSKPNFIWVDFYEFPKNKPGIFETVKQLNNSL